MFHFKNELCFCSFSGIIFFGKWGSTLSLSSWSDKNLWCSKLNGSVIFNLFVLFFSWCLYNPDSWCGFSKIYRIFMGHLTIQMVHSSKNQKKKVRHIASVVLDASLTSEFSPFVNSGARLEGILQKTLKIRAELVLVPLGVSRRGPYFET